MHAHVKVAILLGAAVFAASGAAAAAGDARGLGQKHELILSADRLLPVFSYASASVTRRQNNIDLSESESGAGSSLLLGRNVGIDESFMINVHTLPRVAFDFTVVPKLTLGAALAFGFGLGGSHENEVLTGGLKGTLSTDSPTTTAIGLAPRVGYIIPLSNHLAFWPRAGFGYYSVSTRRDRIRNNDPNDVETFSTTDTLLSLDLDPQLVIAPTEHFFFHVGPLANLPLSGSRSNERSRGGATTTETSDLSLFHVGVQAGLGGWLSL